MYNWAGKTRNISCHTKGEPVPAVEWWRFNYRIRTNETFRIYDLVRNSNLQVTVREQDQEWIYGFYTCRARNNLGEGDQEIELKRAGRLPILFISVHLTMQNKYINAIQLVNVNYVT